MTPPFIQLSAPGEQFSEEYPIVWISWCDDQSLNASTRWIKVNGVDRTVTFSYGSSPLGCVGSVKAQSRANWQGAMQVAFHDGENTIEAHICDNAANCTTEQWTVVRGTDGPPVITLKNHNGDNRDRSLCLTSGAGEGAAWQCGDLLVSHSMPGYATMGRERSLTLLYNSAQAFPRAAVAMTVNQTGVGTPTSVRAILAVPGVGTDSATYNGWASPGVRQVALAVTASGAATGLYPFTFSVQNIYEGGAYTAAVSDTLIVVNRVGSGFGRGWWLAGVEELVLSQPGNKILWVGGDGSAKVYRNVGTNTWQAAAGGYRDTLTYDPATTKYTRTLRHGIQVKFNANGRHTETVNRVGQATGFGWTGSPARLTVIQVPPGPIGSGTNYILAYDGSLHLDWIMDPANRLLDAVILTSRLTSLGDPDGYSTAFAYDGSARMTSRTTRRGYTTHFSYGNGLRVTQVKVPLNPTAGDTAVTAFEPWDEKGLATGPTGQTAVDTALVHTTVLGPRVGVPDDAKFSVDRWGAPMRITDPIGTVTTLARGDATVPALVTQVTYGDNRIVKMTWDARGNLTQQRDSTWHLDALPTAVTRWTYLSPNTKDAPDSIIDPEGIVQRYTYNTWGLVSDATAPNGHVTHVDFVPSGSLAGLTQAVVEQQVPTWDTVTRTEPVQNQRTAFAFNALGNVVSDTSPMGRIRTYARDGVQRVTNVFDPANHRTELVYDQLNRLLESKRYVSDSGLTSPIVTLQHYDIDVRDLIVDPRGVIRRYQFDAANRLTAEIDDFDRAESTFYNRAGLIDAVRPRFFEDSVGRAIRHWFDAAGRLTRTTWPTRELVPGDSVVNTYDGMGRLLTATQSNRKVTRTYFANGAVKSEVQGPASGSTGIVTVHYSYDRAGRRLWYRSGTAGDLAHSDSVWYRYNSGSGDLRTIGVRWRGTGAPVDSVRFYWDSLGRRDSVVYRNGTVVRFAYDGDGMRRLICSRYLSGPPEGGALNFTEYHRNVDAEGLTRLTQHASSGLPGCGEGTPVPGSDSMAYDSRHQLLWHRGSGFSDAYRYDESGNMTVHQTFSALGTLLDNVRFATEGNNSNRLTAFWDAHSGDSLDATALSYDRNGGRIIEQPHVNGSPTSTAGSGYRQYWYDALGRTTGTAEWSCIPGPGGEEGPGVDCMWGAFMNLPTACRYDPLGRLLDVCQSNMPFLGYDGENVVRTGSDALTLEWSFVHGPGLDDPIIGYLDGGSSRYLYYVTDGDGRQLAVADTLGYDATEFAQYKNGGKLVGGTRFATSFNASRLANPQMFQLSFFRNRFYDQETGRWTQEDPIGVAGGTNLYGYVGNNPV